jgi:hypothetical protein
MSIKAVNAFLDWFDGWSENIEGQPSAKQWDRLKSRIMEIPRLDDAPSAAHTAMAAVTAAIEPGTMLANGRAFMDERSWRAGIKDELEAMGCDQAVLMSSQEPYDGRVDPVTVAHMIYSVD